MPHANKLAPSFVDAWIGEHPGWERSQAKSFCDALQQRLITTLPGYTDGPWLITASSLPASIERRSRLRAAQQA